MPWCEYQIKSFGYQRQEEDQWKKVRYMVWHTLTSSMVIDSNKLPDLQKFMTNESRVPIKVDDTIREKFNKEYELYLKSINKNTA